MITESRLQMRRNSFFPVGYGVVAAAISFIAILLVTVRSFHLPAPLAILIASAGGIWAFVTAYFSGRASIEIKRIVYEYHLTDQQLATITGRKASDFPIYEHRLRLIIPKRHWPRVLAQLQQYEEHHLKQEP